MKKKISKKTKVAATQAFTDLGFSLRDISAMVGIDQKTVMKYQKDELDEEFQQFSSTIKKIYLTQDFELSQLALKKIKDKIDSARFFELVGLFKTVRELQRTIGPSTAVQVNFNQHIQKEKNEFNED
jgi:hypothetical protein